MNKKLNKSSPIPLYLQLSGIIEEAVLSGYYPIESKIPSEQELMKTYSVSRVTVRQTMDYLASRGIVLRKQGIGTFVSSNIISQNMNDIIGFYPGLINKGTRLETNILAYDVIFPEANISANLQLKQGDKVLKLVRQFFIEERLVVVDQVYIPNDIAEHWTKEEAIKKGSFQLIQDNAGIRLNNSTLNIRAATVTREMAELLHIKKNDPVLELRRLTYSTDQRPVEYTVFYFPGHSYELTAKLTIGHQHGLKLNKKE